MKIVLFEEGAAHSYPERAFTAEIIKIGRDPLECHIVFDQSEWPMVSRRHAEFRQRAGRCLLVDTNSKFGTFLDGERIADPAEIGVGMRVQFGAGGPLMLVTAVEQAAAAQSDPSEGSFRNQATLRDVTDT